MPYWLQIEDAITPYNVRGEVLLASWQHDTRLDEIGRFSASSPRGAAGSDLLIPASGERVGARCFSLLHSDTLPVEEFSGVIDQNGTEQDSRLVAGLGFGVELTQRVVPRLALYTNFGADPLPAGVVLGAILAYAPPGWSATGVPSRDIYYDVRRVTLLTALQKVAELSGDHFVIGPGRVIHWLSAPTASGLRAEALGEPILLEADPSICLITKIRVSSETRALYTRLYLTGGGDDNYRLTLLGSTRFGAPGNLPGDYVSGDYTLHIDADPANCYLVRTDAEVFYGEIDAIRTNEDVVVLKATAAGVTSASNQLADLARDLLDEACVDHTIYEVELAQVQGLLAPGQTLELVYRDYELTDAGTTDRWLDIATDVLVLAVSVQLDGDDGRTVSVTVADSTYVGRWPRDEAGIMAALWRSIKANSAYKQGPVRTETFTMTATVLLVINDDRVDPTSYIVIVPLNAAAVARQAGAGHLEAVPGTKLIQFQTHDGSSAAGTEQYRYLVVA